MDAHQITIFLAKSMMRIGDKICKLWLFTEHFEDI